MKLLESIVLGIVEGVTEYLPISSTGHLILTEHLMGIQESEGAKVFAIAVQLGAIAAVLVLYRDYLLEKCSGLIKANKLQYKISIRFFSNLFVAFLPSAVVGLIAGSWIKRHWFNPQTVMAALFVGGVMMIVVEYQLSKRKQKYTSYEAITFKESLFIGLCQCLSLWPGFSRSMSTIMAGRIMGLNAKDASEFSFLLALPTLVAATLYEMAKALRGGLEFDSSWWMSLGVGLVVSFVVALIVIKAFLNFLRKYPLSYFGYYRIVLAMIIYFLLN